MTEFKEPKPKDLMELGTRYDHYVELRESWLEAIEDIKKIDDQNKSSSDYTILERLSIGVSLIEKRLDRLSQFDTKRFELKRQLDAIPRVKNERNQ